MFERETVYTALTDCGLPEDGSVELEAFILTLIRLVRRVQTSDGAAVIGEKASRLHCDPA